MSTQTTTQKRARFVRTAANYELDMFETDSETPMGESMTVPDQALSLADILNRHARGLEVPTFEGTYSEEEIPNLEALDLSERATLAQQNSAYIHELQGLLQNPPKPQTKQPEAPVTAE